VTALNVRKRILKHLLLVVKTMKIKKKLYFVKIFVPSKTLFILKNGL
jgi:hypothetical protein